MLVGSAEERKLLNIGALYNRRILMNRIVDRQYGAEVMPVALESDPVLHTSYMYTTTNPPTTVTDNFSEPTVGECRPSSGSGGVPGYYSYTCNNTCGRRWTIGEAMSPFGFQWNFRTRHKWQPFLDGHGGYMYSTQEIPVDHAGSFNFTFDFGAGIELFRTHARSIRAEYRFHHLSNADTARENPGVDCGLFQLTYCFGH
ncbi:MAG TPA: acyloxyacyl hydrolase [Acidobacteriaceae bacterium]|nr:acyloxyacyl hydrolase [Acidobacteriaceae bacterium]